MSVRAQVPKTAPAVWHVSLADSEPLQLAVVRSARRTLALHVTGQGVEARAPLTLPRERIEGFVREKADWIRRKQAEVMARDAARLATPHSVLLRGVGHALHFIPGSPRRALFRDGQCVVIGVADWEAAQPLIARALRAEAAADFPARLQAFSGHWLRAPRALKLSSARKRWGSCTSRGTVNLAWRLVMAPDYAIDYVIAHELAHLLEMNHSPRFWTICRALAPRTDEARAWLTAHGAGLHRLV